MRRRETSHRWHPPQWCCSFFFMGCIFLYVLRRRRGASAIAPEAIVYYSSDRLVCRGRGFKRGSRGRKNFFFLSPSIRTRRRLSVSSALRLFFLLTRPNADKTPFRARNSHVQRADIRRRSLPAFSLPPLSRGGEVLIRRRRWRGLSLSSSHAVPAKRSAAVCKLCCREAQRRGLRN